MYNTLTVARLRLPISQSVNESVSSFVPAPRHR